MKPIYVLLITVFVLSCNKNESTETIQHDDLSASVAMAGELSAMQQSVNSLMIAPNHTQRLYWDSVYHHHDSLFWHHHNVYHHSTYTHDDHSHQWIPYDPIINHHGHHHPQYPGHLNDSLVTTTNNHHHVNCEHHPGHHICHHHTMDSLHHVHNIHHP
ncbi:MAG: hypothetical protein IM581_16070 [Chitinophagaceae bacterium]|jgi:hypothetical protein|nr:hypothetical protein [Chitinophagaceae bacterium]